MIYCLIDILNISNDILLKSRYLSRAANSLFPAFSNIGPILSFFLLLFSPSWLCIMETVLTCSKRLGGNA